MKLCDFAPDLAAALDDLLGPIIEAPTGPQTAAMMRRTQDRKRKADARVQSVRKANAERLTAAQLRVTDL